MKNITYFSSDFLLIWWMVQSASVVSCFQSSRAMNWDIITLSKYFVDRFSARNYVYNNYLSAL